MNDLNKTTLPVLINKEVIEVSVIPNSEGINNSIEVILDVLTIGKYEYQLFELLSQFEPTNYITMFTLNKYELK
jgi:hypothetical protein